ncbi:cellulose binding domain-containing protein [Micromonospora sp. WMMD882]|uniref:cellulose binding domain-containing protein n=1 Tax=Micromonospora sp. WMMD882 TaxID=3015151 RepID=UPI00248AAECF|nr:cellulose binding domain-containing protein [Micromonospora sp. WMMD882]WBB80183.1 cellulose binding domain-containing protein [Micromonospora sp. WMMD882]
MAGSRRARGEGAAAWSWLVVAVGVLVMVVLTAVTLGAISGVRPLADPGPPPPAAPLPATPEPSVSVRKGTAAPGPPRTPGPSRPPSAPAAPTAARSTTPAPAATSSRPRPAEQTPGTLAGSAPTTGQVTGDYRLVDAYSDAFIGEVRVTNRSPTTQRWTVRVEVPGGRLVAAWVESAAQPAVTGSAGRHTFASGADLPPGGSAVLRFHFDGTGRTSRPQRCTVNGSGCAGL